MRISLVQSPSVSSDDEALLWCSDPARVLHLPADQGVIIGRLFSRETFSAIEEMTAAEAARLIDSGGAALIKDYWGAYVAVHQSDAVGGYSITRAPSGFLPCYQVETRTHHIWASDLHTLSAAGIAVSKVDWERLYEHLQWPDVRRRHSCIEGVSELAPGSARTVSGDAPKDQMLWEPWVFTHPDAAIDPDQAVTRLRDTVFASVSALASDYQNIIVG
ncbi:asparagine synthetase B family protein, partial [Novosphingobium clariflavum]